MDIIIYSIIIPIYAVDDLEIIGRSTKTDYYFHMNWGWDGKGDIRDDGYYFAGVFNSKYYSFTENLKIISNIYYTK